MCGAMSTLLVLAGVNLNAGDGADSPQVPSEMQILAAIKGSNNPDNGGVGAISIASLLNKESSQRPYIIKELLAIFNDPKSADVVRAYAAYRLGVLHSTEASDSLAARITFNLVPGGSLYVQESPWWHEPAASALIAIGVPAAPAVIRNLAESDDQAIRSKSVQVLIGIEGGDKDIAALRLQKALNPENDLKRRERLQSALKELAELKLGH